ncbi:MAG: Hsp70 family protein [Desulfobacterales bacterium]
MHVIQGEREMAADNKLLGKLNWWAFRRFRGVPQIEVTLT